MGMLDSLSGGLGDILGGVANAATLGLLNIGGTLLGNKQTQGYNKQLLKLQQYYAERNAAIAHAYELENLATTGCQARQQQAAAYQYDRLLAEYNRDLQALSADEDYQRALKYIADSQASYKNSLVANGYNPLLALSSSIPSYSGRTNSAVGGSVGSGIGSASTSAAPHQGGVPSAPYSDYGASLSRGFSSALEFARTASDIKRNESASLADRASAAENLEKAKTESKHRDPSTAKIYSDVAKNVVGSVGSAAGGIYLGSKAKQVVSALKSGNAKAVVGATQKAAENVVEKGNSAFLGSRVLQAVLPAAVGASGLLGQGAAAYGAVKLREKLSETSPNARKIMENEDKVRKFGRGMW